MATEETEVAEATRAAKKSSGLGKTIGLGLGLFFLVVVAQLVTDIVGCKGMPGLMPGCAAQVETAATGKDAAAAPAKTMPKAPPIYEAFDPPLVISFQEQGTTHFLQVTVEVTARNEGGINAVKTHMPVLRNNLLNIFSGKGFADLTSRDGKEALRKECLAEVQRVLKANTGNAGVEDLYFTSFVVR